MKDLLTVYLMNSHENHSSLAHKLQMFMVAMSHTFDLTDKWI